jgi:negative regulator of flagellin synthesis FlgM
MQIYGPSQLHGAQSIHAPHALRAAEPTSNANSAASIADRLDISEAGQIASRMAELPDVRADRVANIRAAIADGTYETGDRLSMAVDRLLDEIA